jgi:hypothetical protein
MQLAEFLANVPPGVEEQIEGLFKKREPAYLNAPNTSISGPDIEIHCDNSKCKGTRYFHTISTPEVQSVFEQAARETQFRKAVEDVKSVIPQELSIDGHNPLTLLHSALSQGLHANTEEQCLEMATSIRIVLTELSERISIALKDEVELKQALKTLMRRESP